MTTLSQPAEQLGAAAAAYTRAFMDDPFSVWVMPDPVRREHGLPRFFRMAMRHAMRFGGRVEVSDQLEGLHARDVNQPHWYLWLLAVDPPFQGKGLGGAMLRPRLREADRDALPCYLETAKESNVSLYRRFGFDVLRQERLGQDGPRFWTMLRAPR